MTSLNDLIKSRPQKETFNPPADEPLDKTSGGAPPYAFPPELIKELAGKTEAEISSTLSKFRTGLSEHRTRISEHRTDLSEHRTDLSDYRSKLSGHRTSLSDIRSHMANERTHLSQVRTAVSLMSFGITLNRFSITLRESHLMPEDRPIFRQTENVGLGMVILGIVLLAWSVWRFERVYHDIETLTFKPPRLGVLILSLTIMLLGAASTVWMISGD